MHVYSQPDVMAICIVDNYKYEEFIVLVTNYVIHLILI